MEDNIQFFQLVENTFSENKQTNKKTTKKHQPSFTTSPNHGYSWWRHFLKFQTFFSEAWLALPDSHLSAPSYTLSPPQTVASSLPPPPPAPTRPFPLFTLFFLFYFLSFFPSLFFLSSCSLFIKPKRLTGYWLNSGMVEGHDLMEVICVGSGAMI